MYFHKQVYYMPQITLTLVKSFTQDRKQGNPVGVCLSQELLSDETYFQITRQTGFSECVFIKFVDNIPTLRFFSPENEMNMCGHATLAAAHILHDKYRPSLFNTKSGNVNIQYQASGLIEMALTAEPCHYTNFVSTQRIVELLGISPHAIKSDPVKISMGTPKVLVELQSTNDLLTMQPNFEAIAEEIPQGIYPFVMINEALYYARQFNPATGVDEDPVTGVAAAALGVHLRSKNIHRFTIEQGHVLNKIGTIFVDVSSGIKIGGHAIVYDELVLDI